MKPCKSSRFDDLSRMTETEFADFLYLLNTARKVARTQASSLRPLLDLIIDASLQLSSMLSRGAPMDWDLNPDSQRVLPEQDLTEIAPNLTGQGPDKVRVRKINSPLSKRKGFIDPLVNELESPGVAKYVNFMGSTIEIKDPRLALFFDKIAKTTVAIKQTGSLPVGVFLTREDGQKARQTAKIPENSAKCRNTAPSEETSNKRRFLQRRRRSRRNT